MPWSDRAKGSLELGDHRVKHSIERVFWKNCVSLWPPPEGSVGIVLWATRVVTETGTLKCFVTEGAGENMRDTGGLWKMPPGAVTRRLLAKEANVSFWKSPWDSCCCHVLHQEHLLHSEALLWDPREKRSFRR